MRAMDAACGGADDEPRAVWGCEVVGEGETRVERSGELGLRGFAGYQGAEGLEKG